MRARTKAVLKRNLTAYAFLSPNIAFFLVFTLVPVFFAALISFYDWDLLREPIWISLQNYRDLLGWSVQNDNGGAAVRGASLFGTLRGLEPNDILFWRYLGNTIFFMIGIPFNIVLSLMVAMLVNQKLRGMIFFRTVFFLPVVASLIACSILWRWIYNPEFGILNYALNALRVPTFRWLSDPNLVKPAIIAMQIWKGFGYNMLLYLAGLQGIPERYYDAAAVDGARWFQRFWHITLPMLSATTFFIVIMSVIQGFQVFGAVYIMTKGGPSGASTPLVYYIYSYGFQWFRMGYASAIAWVLFILTATFTWIQWRYGERKVYYE